MPRHHPFATCKGIWIPESGKSRRTLGFGIRNPTNDWNPESRPTDKNWNPVPEIQNPRLSWIPLYGVTSGLLQNNSFRAAFKRWICAIHRINHYPADKYIMAGVTVIWASSFPKPSLVILPSPASNITLAIWVRVRAGVTVMPTSLRFWEWGYAKRGDAHITLTVACSRLRDSGESEKSFKNKKTRGGWGETGRRSREKRE